MKKSKKGFTLIELMIVVAIIGILAAIAIPKFADLINKSKEGATKGALASVRSAIQVYYGDSEGWFPADNLAVLIANGKYINSIPQAKLPTTGHADSNTVTAFTQSTAAVASDGGGWSYVNDPTATGAWGNFAASCIHQDIAKKQTWSAF